MTSPDLSWIPFVFYPYSSVTHQKRGFRGRLVRFPGVIWAPACSLWGKQCLKEVQVAQGIPSACIWQLGLRVTRTFWQDETTGGSRGHAQDWSALSDSKDMFGQAQG